MKLHLVLASLVVMVFGMPNYVEAGPQPNERGYEESPANKPCDTAGATVEWDWPDMLGVEACLPKDTTFPDSCGNPIFPAYRTTGRQERYRFICTQDWPGKGARTWKRACAIHRFRTDECAFESRRCYCNGQDMPPSEYPVVVNMGWTKWQVFTPVSPSLDCWGPFPEGARQESKLSIDSMMSQVRELDKKGYRGDLAYKIQQSKSLAKKQKADLMDEIAKKPTLRGGSSCAPKATVAPTPPAVE